MRGVNEVRLMGNLGRDPEIRYTGEGYPVAIMQIATSETTYNAGGESKEQTEWHRVRATGKMAQYAAERLQKGSRVYIEGKNTTRQWEEYGQEKRLHEIKAHRVDGLTNLKAAPDIPHPDLLPRRHAVEAKD